jgi:hypothetical protein
MIPTHRSVRHVQAMQFQPDAGFKIQDAFTPFVSFCYGNGMAVSFLQVFAPDGSILIARPGDWVIQEESGDVSVLDEYHWNLAALEPLEPAEVEAAQTAVEVFQEAVIDQAPITEVDLRAFTLEDDGTFWVPPVEPTADLPAPEVPPLPDVIPVLPPSQNPTPSDPAPALPDEPFVPVVVPTPEPPPELIPPEILPSLPEILAEDVTPASEEPELPFSESTPVVVAEPETTPPVTQEVTDAPEAVPSVVEEPAVVLEQPVEAEAPAPEPIQAEDAAPAVLDEPDAPAAPVEAPPADAPVDAPAPHPDQAEIDELLRGL